MPDDFTLSIERDPSAVVTTSLRGEGPADCGRGADWYVQWEDAAMTVALCELTCEEVNSQDWRVYLFLGCPATWVHK